MRSLTRAGWAVAVGALALVVTARLLGLVELYVLAATAAAAVVLALVVVRRPPAALTIERTVRPRRAHIGDQCLVDLRVTNGGTRRTPVVTLVDPVEGTNGAILVLAPLGPGESRAAGYRLPTERRGLVQVGPLDAIRTDALGLASRRHRVGGVVELTVLPAVEQLGATFPHGGYDDPLAGAARPSSGRSGDEEFAALRPYVVGDDLRRIHWATLARTGELSVRQDDPQWQGHVTILLDAREHRTDADQFEVAVSAAASVLNAVAERGDRTRLVVTDGTDTGPTDARSTRDLLFEHLAVVERHPGGTLPEPPADGRASAGELVFITGSLDADELAHLTHLRHRYATTQVVLVAGRDDELEPLDRLGGAAGLEMVVLRPGTPFAVAWAVAAPALGRSR